MVVAEIVPVLVAEIVPVLVAEIVPVLVAEIVPVPVAEIVPVLVAEIVPGLAKAGAEKATTNMPAKAMDLTFFIVLLLVVCVKGDMVGFEVSRVSHFLQAALLQMADSVVTFFKRRAIDSEA